MFAAWNPASLGVGGDAATQIARSRSPSRPDSRAAVQNVPAVVAASEPPWTTGNGHADQWLEAQQVDPDVLQRFAAMPKHKRKTIILKCMEKKPDNMDKWLGACARNWADQDLEARVTGIASVHRSSAPTTGHLGPYSGASAGVPSAPPPVGLSGRQPSSSTFSTAPVAHEAHGAIPNLSSELFSQWPHDKSALIRVASQCLTGGSLAAFLTLPVHDQIALAFTIMVAGPDNPAARSALVDSWFQRLEALRGSSPSPTLPTYPPSDVKKSTIKAQFILAGFPTALGAVVVASVQLILPRFHPQVKWEFCPVVYLHEEAPDGVPVMETFADVGLSLRPEVTSLQKLVGQMNDLWTEWSSGGVKFVLVSCLSHDAGLGGSNPLQAHHLHSKANRWLWGMVSMSQALRSRSGDSHVADVLVCPSKTSDDFAQEVSSLWGPKATGMERFKDDALAGSPRPAFFCTPQGLSIVPVCDSEATKSQPIDNWSGPSVQVLNEVQASLPGFLPSHLAKLATTSLFRERDLTQPETSIFKSLRMRHTSGDERLCSRQFWCRWYGYSQTPVQKVLLEHDACAGMIIPTTGTVAPPGLPASSTSACGQDRYCLGCEKHLLLLSKGYQTYVVTDLLLSLLGKAAKTWTGQDSGHSACWGRSSTVSREHMCGDDCVFLRR